MEPEQHRRGQGQRMRKLEDAFRRTVKYALRGLPIEDVAPCFPGFSATALESLYDAYQQCLHQARAFIEVDFGELCEENGLREKLQGLDALCAAQGLDGAAAAAGGGAGPDPARLARAAALRVKREEVAALRAVLGEVQRRGAEADAELAAARAAAAAAAARLEPLAARLEGLHAASKAWAARPAEAPAAAPAVA